MKEALKRVATYAVARGNELSTWQSVVVIVAAAGWHLKPELRDAILVAGPAGVGLLGVAFPDKFKGPKQ